MNTRAPCLLLLFAGLMTAPAAVEMTEAEVASAAESLVNLPRYVEWPAGSFVVPQTPIMIGVYGDVKVHKRVFDLIHGKVLNGRTVLVRRYRWPQVPNCHMLFIARSQGYRLPWIMKKLEYSSVLTVAEFDDFLQRGGMVRMIVTEEKVRFQVNTLVAGEAGLKFSSKFLTVADKVVTE